MTETALLAALASAKSPAHALLHWHTELHAHIARTDSAVDVAASLKEIEAQVDFFHDDRNKDLVNEVLTEPVLAALGKNYAALLTRSRSALFDIANRHVVTFTDSKKAAPLRSLSCVVLTALYMSFGREIVSFIPVLLATLVKALRKEKNVLQLAQLWYALVRNGGREELNDSLASKLHKLLKPMDNIEASAALHGSLGASMSYKSFDLVTFKATHQSLLHNGLRSHKKIRVATAKSIAEACINLEWDLSTSLELYKTLYLDSNTHEEQVGVIESLVHFTYLNVVRGEEFVTANIDTISQSLLDIYTHERYHAFPLNRKYRTVNHFLYFFSTLLTLVGESNQSSILEHSLMLMLDRETDPWKLITLLKLARMVISNLSSLSETHVEKYRITLWKLCLAVNYELQANAVLVLKEVVVKCPSVLKELLETSLNEVVNNSKQSASDKIAIKSHGLSLIIANLVSLADRDYVPKMVIEEIWKSNREYIKENKTLTEQNKNNLINAWITLSGVFTYHDKVYVESLTDEFMSLWESLDPTSSITALPLASLDLIGHALTALLCYLHNTTPNSAVAKFFVESLTRLRTISNTVKITSGAGPLADMIKKRCYQIYLCCIDFVKSENSSVLIQAVSQLSELPNYEPLMKNEVITPWTKDDGFSNGLTSKFAGYTTDELMIKFRDVKYTESQKEYSIDSVSCPDGSIALGNVKSWISDSTWIDELESTIHQPVATALEHDLSQPVLGEYSLKNVYSPPSRTAIVDTSMEIFIKSFASLSTKVQLSLLETLRTHLLSKTTNESTKVTQAINASLVLHGSLLVAHRENATFDAQVGATLLETIRTLYMVHPCSQLLVTNSEAIGLLISRCDLKEQIPIFIKKVVDDLESDSRAFNALVLSYIYNFNSSHFSEILPVLLKISQDPHPTVHAWSMDALATIIDKHVAMSATTAVQVLQAVEKCYLDDRFGCYSPFNYSNLNSDTDSNAVIAKVLRSAVTSLGFSITELDKHSRETISSLIHSLFWYDNNVNSRLEIVKLIQELSVYDPEMFDKEYILHVLKYLIQTNIGKFIGSELWLNLFEERNEVVPLTSSEKLLDLCLDFISQLVKTSEDTSFITKIEPLVWLCLEQKPESEILVNLVSQWLDATYDLEWFIKLQKLFNASKQQMHYTIVKEKKRIMEKYVHKKVEVDVKDEEAQSITKKSDDEVKGETVDWRCRARIMDFIKQLLGYTERDSKLYSQLSTRVSDLIKISFAASTSSAEELRLSGLRLLGDIITIYAKAKDPIYPTMSLLEQQQAQITSALVPAFNHDSSPVLVAEAIKVVAMFVGSGVVNVSKLERTTKILTGALEDLTTDEDEFKVSDVVITSEVGQKKVRLAILNAWAELKSLNYGQNEELDNLVNEHLELLLPLWISTLKEFALNKHGMEVEDEYYQDCWLNLVEVIGCITETDGSSIQDLLQNDSLGFYYMLYAHCVFSLLKSKDRLKILNVFVKILGYKDLVKLIYYDEIFHESMEVIERLVVTGENEEKLVLLDITTKIFVNYFKVNSEVEFGQNADKLFEILRINLQTITQFISKDEATLRDLAPIELQLIKKALVSISTMISYFPDMIKQDLSASVLSIVADGYSSQMAQTLVPLMLPTVKQVVHDLVLMDDFEILNNFYQIIKPSLNTPFITIATTSVLLSTAPVSLRLDETDIDHIVSNLFSALADPEHLQLATQSIKSIATAGTPTADALLCKIVTRLVRSSLSHADARLYIELLVLIIKHHPSVPLYTLAIPTLLQLSAVHADQNEYWHKRMVSLITINPESFKTALGKLDADQRLATERLVKWDQDAGVTKEEQGQIKLKAFE